MNKVIGLYMKSEWRKYWWSNLRQMLYLVPIIAIVLVMSTTQNIKYINQREFLKDLKYKSITKSDQTNNQTNSIKVYESSLAVVEKIRGANVYRTYYVSELFNLSKQGYSLENTYFTKSNMKGYNPLDLKEGEIILSYDAAKKLKVGIGDKIFLVSDQSQETPSYIVKGIMKTKYAYKNIGSKGTAIINEESNDKLSQFYPNSYYYTFNNTSDDGLNSISLKQEKEETNYFSLPTRSVVMVNAVFPILGLFLIFIIIYREINRTVKRKKKDFSILMSLGLNTNKIMLMLIGMQLLIISLSSVFAILVYKYVLIQKWIGHYVSFMLVGKLFIQCVILGGIAIFLNIHFIKQSIQQLDIVKLLYDKEEI